MSEGQKYLLPPGFRDSINNEAELEFWALSKIMENFSKWSYKKVSTPLLEYTDSIFTGAGEAIKDKTIILQDPDSNNTMAIRSDMTTQISRLVESRLLDEELPLRLCYYGNIIKKKASNSKGDRQLKQVGLELINNSANPKAIAEIIVIALDSLLEIGIENITLDLNTPGLVKKLGDYSEDIIKSFIKRDSSNLPEELANLVSFSGNAEKALEIDTNLMPSQAKMQINYLKNVYEEVKNASLDISITIDYVEDKGFEYQNDIGFSFFSKDIVDEIGRGGQYEIQGKTGCGFSLYLNSFVDSLTLPDSSSIITLEPNVSYSEIKKLQKTGKIVKKAL